MKELIIPGSFSENFRRFKVKTNSDGDLVLPYQEDQNQIKFEYHHTNEWSSHDPHYFPVRYVIYDKTKNKVSFERERDQKSAADSYAMLQADLKRIFGANSISAANVASGIKNAGSRFTKEYDCSLLDLYILVNFLGITRFQYKKPGGSRFAEYEHIEVTEVRPNKQKDVKIKYADKEKMTNHLGIVLYSSTDLAPDDLSLSPEGLKKKQEEESASVSFTDAFGKKVQVKDFVYITQKSKYNGYTVTFGCIKKIVGSTVHLTVIKQGGTDKPTTWTKADRKVITYDYEANHSTIKLMDDNEVLMTCLEV